MGWEIRMVKEVESWMLQLDDKNYNLVAGALTRLEQVGPTLGRPTSDRAKASRHHNMKELRPRSSGQSAIRILYAFDSQRQAILLVAGDKAGNWKRWYEENIPLADERFDDWLKK
ncbi:type II toxin-antitoxin system RelE/ParE family toxin [Corynebacterium sp. 20_84]